MADGDPRPLFEVTDGYELNALYVALMEAKFNPTSRDELQGSPFIARMCERALEALVGWWEAMGRHDVAATYRAAREPGEEVLALVRRRVAECRKWGVWSDAEKAEYVRLLFSPYTPSEPLVQQLASEGGGGG